MLQERLKLSKASVMDNWLHPYELAQGEVGVATEFNEYTSLNPMNRWPN
jgi:hypothetical protein